MLQTANGSQEMAQRVAVEMGRMQIQKTTKASYKTTKLRTGFQLRVAK